jgi:hypothetical protein
MTLIELLNHPCFRSLVRRSSHWSINHISHDGVSIAAVTATELEQVIQDFESVVESIDVHRQGIEECNHDWHKSIDRGTEVCRCGAWR